MKYLAIFVVCAVLSSSLAQNEVCDMTCVQALETWNQGTDKPCDVSNEKIQEIEDCKALLELLDPSTLDQSPCTEEQKQIAAGAFGETENYFTVDCENQQNQPEEVECSTISKRNEINDKVAKCKLTDITSLKLNNHFSQKNACTRLQQVIDCFEAAVGDCKDDSEVETLLSGDVISTLLLAEQFECRLKVSGYYIEKKVSGCSFMSLVKCFNPVLQAFNQQTITETYNLDLITGDLVNAQIIDKIIADQTGTCGLTNNLRWNDISSCYMAAEDRCPFISGKEPYDVSSVATNPRSIVTGLWVKYQTIASLKKVKDYCNTDENGCGNLATRIGTVQIGLSQLNSIQACGQVQNAWSLITSVLKQCSPLRETAALGINAVQHAAEHITRCLADTSAIYANPSQCSEAAQVFAFNGARECTLRMDINSLSASNVCGRVAVAANCLYQKAGSCPPVAKYFHDRFAFFFGFANFNFGCDIKPHTEGQAITPVEGTTCSYNQVMQCYQPLLNQFSVTAGGNGKITLTEIKKLMFSPSDDRGAVKDKVCPKLNGLDLDALKACSKDCKYPSTTLTMYQEYATMDHVTTFDTGNLLDIRSLMELKKQFCSGCDGVDYGAKLNAIAGSCVQTGTDNKLIRVPRAVIYSHYMQKCQPHLGDACREHDSIEGCVNMEQEQCGFLKLVASTVVRDQSEFSTAGQICATKLGSCQPAPKPGPGGPNPPGSGATVNAPGILAVITLLAIFLMR